MHIGVIASLKKGLEHFIYRELEVFAAQGCRVSLFATKMQKGLYNPKEDWTLHCWTVPGVALMQFASLVRFPLRYIRLVIEAVKIGAVVDFALACDFARALKEVDVIYATFGDHKLFIGYFCKKITGKPLAVTIHAYELYCNPNPRLFVRALAACDRIITVTEYNKEYLIGRYQVDPANIEVVRISVDLADYRPQKKFVILIAAYFAERKGHEVLFEAVKQLAREDIEVWVVGGEGAEPSVDVLAMARRAGLESQVAFFGNLSGAALKAVFQACDVFCLPCRHDRSGIAEGFPTVIAEAMAFGKPVITTRHVEIPRILDEILVDENDASALAQAIARAQRSPLLLAELGKKNRIIAERLFSTRNAAKTAAVLSRLSDGGGAGEPRRQASPKLRAVGSNQAHASTALRKSQGI
jgi:colanic acid/amylovoran biosynthesis glycosyltransferase